MWMFLIENLFLVLTAIIVDIDGYRVVVKWHSGTGSIP